eukprot:m.16120 g.16120  ORF g.16120 m.16120 type:complete len:1361 (+) comp10277_c0_seq1:123-4205(+)
MAPVPHDSPKSIASITLHRKATISFLEHVPFAIFYAVALYQCYLTFGLPYQNALEIAEREFDDDGNDIEIPCKPLPSAFVPSFLSRLALAAVVLLHGLMFLGQHWSVSFRALVKFPSASIRDATFAKVIPPPHHGKSALVPITKTRTGSRFFVFQKHKYIFEQDEDGIPMFRQVTAPVNRPLEHYIFTQGLDEEEAADRFVRYGENKFEILMPSFKELYLEGLLSPFTVFQMFCILLWCLDEYWQYSLFTLFMMLVFEGTVVMSRRKNLQTLRGMNNAPRVLQVFRDGEWKSLVATQLLPGDLISLVRGSASDDVIPCDCLLLQGSIIVNEATLTGESVPQMKEALPKSDDLKLPLDVQGTHKPHVLYGGTRILQHSGVITDEVPGTINQEAGKIKNQAIISRLSGTPDGGCLCYVLRTGFDSSQGNMVRMIEFSSESVSGNTLEALLLVSFLLMFAIAASTYVLKKGLEEDREQFDLLLHCILIVTSVIPPELNMQLALAVNSSLLTLMKMHIFCTEPYRIPMAGKVQACLFDKTGTITSDELVAAGVVAASSASSNSTAPVKPVPCSQAPPQMCYVMAGCHSLVNIDGATVGDPLESAALKAIRWRFDATTNTSYPRAPLPKEPTGALMPTTGQSNPKVEQPKYPSVKILTRHVFSSKLQRMSVIARIATSPSNSELYALVKGSAEKIETLLAHSPSAWFHATHQALARQGMRVIALASKKLTGMSQSEACAMTRAQVESDLHFTGFVPFQCLMRKDSAAVLQELQRSSHTVTMITGDAILTALHIAGQVGIVREDKEKVLMLEAEGDDATPVWVLASDSSKFADFDVGELESLNKTHDLCVTGKSLTAATDLSPEFWRKMHCIKVFARMTPDKKEKVLTALKDQGFFTLMCGDGANDVGALKQAHVGIALLSGFGTANVEKPMTDEERKKLKEEEKKRRSITPAELAARKKKHKEEIAKKNQERKDELQKIINRRVEAGENAVMASIRAVKELTERESKKRKDLIQKQGGNAFAASAAMMAGTDEDDGSVPMIKLGDASVASPFTSKKPSISSAVDIIRQGRCTLVTSLQMYQILALNCLISSFSLSVLYLDGVKYGDRQMTCMGLLSTVSFLSISRAKPLAQLSSVRPLTSIFHPALFLSLLGQFAIHLGTMYYTRHLTRPYLPENYAPSLEGKFEPNLVNSVVYLVTCVQQVSVFFVNYKGPPFNQSLAENSFLIWSLALCGVGAFIAATNVMPMFNKWLQLVEYPSEAFGRTVVSLLAFDVAVSLLWDRLMLLVFAPHIFMASMKSVTTKEIMQLTRTLILVGGLMYFFLQNPEQYIEAFEKAQLEQERMAAQQERLAAVQHAEEQVFGDGSSH